MSSPVHRALAALVAGPLAAATVGGALAVSAITVRVEATANPWAAGRAGPIDDGTLPAEIVVPDGESILSFPHVSGSWSNTNNVPFSADGEHPAVGTAYDCGGPPPCSVVASNGLSGLTDAASFWYLAGVFIGPGTLGGRPPTAVDYTDRHEFAFLEPALGQVFFIGDGRMSNGTVQGFQVPPGATRLFLGMVDNLQPGDVAGWYRDNHGWLEVTASWRSVQRYSGVGIIDRLFPLVLIGAVALLMLLPVRARRPAMRQGPLRWGQAEMVDGSERPIVAGETPRVARTVPGDDDS